MFTEAVEALVTSYNGKNEGPHRTRYRCAAVLTDSLLGQTPQTREKASTPRTLCCDAHVSNFTNMGRNLLGNFV